MEKIKISKELLTFIEKSSSVFHAVKSLSDILLENNFIALDENQKWNLEEGKSYFVTRNQSSIIAFKYSKKDYNGFNIIASHSDSPCFKIKDNFDIKVRNSYTKLNVEKYGGMIMSTWFDRALSVAGRVIINTKTGLESKLVNIDKDLLIIPNLAIHAMRDHNDNRSINPQIEMLPLLGDENADLLEIISKHLSVNKDDISSHELCLYPREKGRFIGANDEFILSPKLDDLQCAFTSIKSLCSAKNSQRICLAVVLDNEEVGSRTKQGADSTFLYDTLSRISSYSNKNYEDYTVTIANSILVSADNAHALHPNYADKSDSTNVNFINGGPVIKINANQSYSTDAITASIFKKVCDNANVPYQVFHNRSDLPCGGTLGNISTSHVSISSVDIGIPQFAMHSAVETAGSKDTFYAYKAFESFYNTQFNIKGNTIEMKLGD